MTHPLVSVITITHNRGKLIGRCIQSVLNQTYTNIEHIVVDGASDDNTDEVIAGFNDIRLKYIKLESNWPVAKTINYGVEQSKGMFVTFLDSDDEYLPTKVEKQLNKILTLPDEYGMVYCWMTYIDQKTMKVVRLHNPQLKGDVSELVVEKPIVSGTPTYFFKRKAFLANGGWKDKDEIGVVSDWEMGARFCQKWKVDFVAESLINVYVNHNSIRMSSRKYYNEEDKSEIVFHKYFLETYKKIFNKYPSKRLYHYSCLSASYMRLHDFKNGFKYYFLMLRFKPSMKQIVRPLLNIFV